MTNPSPVPVDAAQLSEELEWIVRKLVKLERKDHQLRGAGVLTEDGIADGWAKESCPQMVAAILATIVGGK